MYAEFPQFVGCHVTWISPPTDTTRASGFRIAATHTNTSGEVASDVTAASVWLQVTRDTRTHQLHSKVTSDVTASTLGSNVHMATPAKGKTAAAVIICSNTNT